MQAGGDGEGDNRAKSKSKQKDLEATGSVEALKIFQLRVLLPTVRTSLKRRTVTRRKGGVRPKLPLGHHARNRLGGVAEAKIAEEASQERSCTELLTHNVVPTLELGTLVKSVAEDRDRDRRGRGRKAWMLDAVRRQSPRSDA